MIGKPKFKLGDWVAFNWQGETIEGYHNFSVTMWIDEQFVEEDNIEKPI